MIRLLAAVDPIKDQTFFLSTLTQLQLRRSMFPVGSLTKQQVRRIAVDNGMGEIAQKPEVCLLLLLFLPHFFIANNLNLKKMGPEDWIPLNTNE